MTTILGMEALERGRRHVLRELEAVNAETNPLYAKARASYKRELRAALRRYKQIEAQLTFST